jgi:hypothetical protein
MCPAVSQDSTSDGCLRFAELSDNICHLCCSATSPTVLHTDICAPNPHLHNHRNFLFAPTQPVRPAAHLLVHLLLLLPPDLKCCAQSGTPPKRPTEIPPPNPGYAPTAHGTCISPAGPVAPAAAILTVLRATPLASLYRLMSLSCWGSASSGLASSATHSRAKKRGSGSDGVISSGGWCQSTSGLLNKLMGLKQWVSISSAVICKAAI